MSNRPPLRRSRHRVLALAALLAGGLLISGCSAPQAGAAATIGDSRISEQQLTTQVQAVLAAQRQPVDTPSQALTSKTLGRMITLDLVQRLAVQNGIVISQGDIDQELAAYDQQVGGRDGVIKAFAEQDVAPSQIESLVRMNLEAQALGVKLDPKGTADSQGKAVFSAINVLSDEIGVTSSPRFGAWDALALSVGPSPNDLSMPPATAK
jgi:hypothetical protein